MLILNAIMLAQRTSGVSDVLHQAAAAGLGLLLIAGLWTPVAGALAALDALLNGFSSPAGLRYWVLLAAVGIALALLGPGAWSIDAKLFGWKRIEIGDGDG
jgi:uncharacterized membrane protein YphA (DoxX/SURF4 family)